MMQYSLLFIILPLLNIVTTSSKPWLSNTMSHDVKGQPEIEHHWNDMRKINALQHAHNSTLRVALIAAGEIRSFAFVVRSWERFVLSPTVGRVFFFAHVTVRSKQCGLFMEGINAIQEIATDFEIASAAPLRTKNIEKKLPKSFKGRNYLQFDGMHPRGDIIDMWSRRSRAYAIASAYAKRHSMEWDLVVVIRLDSAFYSPPIDYMGMFTTLSTFKANNGNNAIITPRACAFSGVCDRFAVGLPTAMDVYFQEEWIFEVLRWVDKPRGVVFYMDGGNDKVSDRLKGNPNDEFFLRAWLLLNNITNIDLHKQSSHATNFITLRTRASNEYCRLNRQQMVSVNDSVLLWTNRLTASDDHSSYTGDIDMHADAQTRCGNVHLTNVTELCSSASCHCEGKGDEGHMKICPTCHGDPWEASNTASGKR